MPPQDDPLGPLATLADPVRRRLYAHVSGSRDAVSRDEAAEAIGIKRPLAAYHLDRLARAGLLDVHYERPPGRGGPGAGRPTKRYRRAATAYSVSLPPRHYELAAQVLATAVAESMSDETRSALVGAARRVGERLAEQAAASARGRRGATARTRAVVEVLAGHGYEPYVDGDGSVRLGNCPFHTVASEHPETVCGMNLAMLESLRTDSDSGPELQPRPGECCVAFPA